MNKLTIPYAEHPTRGIVTPDDEQDGRGLKANVTCLNPDCRAPLVHRKASIDGKRAHFAHRSVPADFEKCWESAVHANIKTQLAALREILSLPRWHGEYLPFRPICGHAEVDISIPRKSSPRRIDVLLTNAGGQRLGIEVWYSNRKDESVRLDYRAARLSVLELRVADEHWDVTKEDLQEMLLEDARWLVRPFEPFHQDSPQVSILPESFYESRLAYSEHLSVEQAMSDAGFNPGPQCWEKHWRGFVARFTDANIGQAVSPDMTWKPVPGSRFQIERPQDWVLEVDASWDWPNKGLDSCREFFRAVVEACASDQSDFRPVDWNGHYKGPSRSSLYTSTTAMSGLLISVDERGNWSLKGNGYTCRNIEHPEVPVYLRGQAKLRTSIRGEVPMKHRPGETRKVAERWGKILQKVVWRPPLPETKREEDGDDTYLYI